MAEAVSVRQPGYEGADPLIDYVLRDYGGEGKREAEVVRRRVDVLQKIFDDGKIEEYQLKAGRRFQIDAERAQLRAQTSPEMVSISSYAYFGLSDGKLSALQSASEARGRLRRAMTTAGRHGGALAVYVLLEGLSLRAACKFIGIDHHGAIPLLSDALDVLDRVYAERDEAA